MAMRSKELAVEPEATKEREITNIATLTHLTRRAHTTLHTQDN